MEEEPGSPKAMPVASSTIIASGPLRLVTLQEP